MTAGSGVNTFLGNGDGTFTRVEPLYVDPVSVAVGDLDQDGKLDLAVASSVYVPGSWWCDPYGYGCWGGGGYSYGAVNVLLGQGDGTFRQGSGFTTVVIKGDTRKENNETFYVNLSNAYDAVIADSRGIGTIQDDDKRR